MTNCPKDLIPNDQQAECMHLLGAWVEAPDEYPHRYYWVEFTYCPKCGQELEHS